MKKFLLFFVLAACVLVHGTAQPLASDYVHTVQGLGQADLKTALHDLIQPRALLNYGGGGTGRTWAGFAVADDMGDGIIRDRYSNTIRHFNGVRGVEGMNIEHIWANSWWGHTVNSAYCDLFNLYPADRDANGHKSNNPIGVVTHDVAFDNGVTRVGLSDSYRSDELITVWEPADQWKGDFARTYFYMATTYQHMSAEWQTKDGLLTVDPASWQTIRPWVSQLMLEWAEADPVDDIERDRNEVIYGIQGNRNPYVDCPQLADYIWGNRLGETFYMEPESTSPEIFVPSATQGLDFGMQALHLGMSRQLTVRGRNFPNGLHISVEGEGFCINTTSLTAEEVLQGTSITLTSTATVAGLYEAELVLTDGADFTQRIPLKMTMMDGIPAYPPKDILCSQYIKRFTISWMDMHLAAGETYLVQVYTLDGQGNPQSIKDFPVEVADTFLVVDKGLSALKDYYVKVSAEGGSLQSNEVLVSMPAIKPSFSVPNAYLSFSSVPGEPSTAQAVTLTVKNLPAKTNEVFVECSAPFELCFDGETWEQQRALVLAATVDTTFQVRLGEVGEVGAYEGELELSTSGANDIFVTLAAQVDAALGFFETFETGKKGVNGYAEADVTCVAARWKLDNAMFDGSAHFNDGRSVRLRTGGALTMLEDKPSGCDSLWFYAGLFNKDTGVLLTASYSQNGGLSWTPIVSDLSFVNGEWKRYGYKVERDGPIRLKFEASGTKEKRINIDDVQMSNYGVSVDIADIDWTFGTDAVQVYSLDGRYVGEALPARRGIYIIRQGNRFIKRLIP